MPVWNVVLPTTPVSLPHSFPCCLLHLPTRAPQWKDGARNLGGGSNIARNSYIGAHGNRSTQLTKQIKLCRICKTKLPQDANYCVECAFAKGICSMCGVKVTDLTFDKRGTEWHGKQERLKQKAEREADQARLNQEFGQDISTSAPGAEGTKKKKKRKAEDDSTGGAPKTAKTGGGDGGDPGATATGAGAVAVDQKALALDAIARRTGQALNSTVGDSTGAGVSGGGAGAQQEWMMATDGTSGRPYYFNCRTGSFSIP